MSRYRLTPSPTQEAILREHCAHARYVWNLAVEQHSWWRPGHGERTRLLCPSRPTDPGPCHVRVAGRRQPDGATAGAARLRPGHGQLFRWHPPQAHLAQSESKRRVPDRRGQARPHQAAVPPCRRSVGAQGGMGAVPLVPPCPRREVLPCHDGPGRALAYRVRRCT